MCPVLNQCTKNTGGRGRVIERNENQDAVDRNNFRIKTQIELYNRRQQICEHPFGTIKRQWGIYIHLTQRITKSGRRDGNHFYLLQFKTNDFNSWG